MSYETFCGLYLNLEREIVRKSQVVSIGQEAIQGVMPLAYYRHTSETEDEARLKLQRAEYLHNEAARG